MKYILYIFFLSLFFFSCSIIKEHKNPLVIKGKLIISENLKNKSSHKDSKVYLIASYSRYPNPYFFLNCKEYLDFEDRLNKLYTLKIDSLDKSKKIISVTQTDSSGNFLIEIPNKIYKNSWLINKSYPKYEYLMLIFVKKNYRNKIKLVVPNCDSIMAEFENIQMELIE